MTVSGKTTMFGPFSAKAREEKRLRTEREKAEKARIAAEKAAARKAAWDRFWFRVKLVVGFIVAIPVCILVSLVAAGMWFGNPKDQSRRPVYEPGSTVVRVYEFSPADALHPSNVGDPALVTVHNGQPVQFAPAPAVVDGKSGRAYERLVPVGPASKTAAKYWLNTKTKVRHNSSCQHYGNSKQGRSCSADEGTACHVCGG